MALLLGSIMNVARPLPLILAALTGCAVLASMWLLLSNGHAPLPAEVVEGAVLQQGCDRDDDVSITVAMGLGELTITTLKIRLIMQADDQYLYLLRRHQFELP